MTRRAAAADDVDGPRSRIMSRRGPCLALFAVALLWPPAAAGADLAGEAALCRDETAHPDVRIGACTHLIRWGDHDDRSLAAAFHARGLAHDALGDGENAVSDFSESIRLNPGNAVAYNNRANAYAALGVFDRALADFAESLRLDPEDGSTFNNRGTVYQKLADHRRALAHYDEAIRLDPGLMLARNNRCVAHRSVGEFAKALEDCTRAIEMEPTYWRAWMNRGIVHYLMEEYAAAADDYQAAIGLEPLNAVPYNALAWLRATAPDRDVRDGAEAMRLARKAVRFGDTAQHRDTLAAAYAETGRFARAVEEEERAIALSGDSGRREVVAGFRERLQLYRRGRPFRQR